MSTQPELALRRLAETHDRDEPVSVILEVDPRDEATELAQRSTAAIQQRTLAQSARECLPPQREEGADQSTIAMPRPRAYAAPDAVVGSLSVRAKPTEPSSPKDAQALALERLSPLLNSEQLRRALETDGSSLDEVGARLWASSSIAVQLTVGELEALAESVGALAGIYPNRSIRVPPVAHVLDLPEPVLENRASSWGIRKIGALASWGAYGACGAGARVAILDTGVDATHPDLAGKVKGWAEFDNNGKPVPGSTPSDSRQHGTHVAGTVAGGNASGQWIGVAPEADLYCAKVLGPQGGTDASVQAGMSWAISQEVDVISMSLGGLTLSSDMPPTYTKAIVEALTHGIPVVIAIGNDGSETTGSPGNDVFSLAVGATDYLDRVAGFSGGRTHIVQSSPYLDPNYLPLVYSKPQVSAPGVAVVSSIPGGKWAAFSGTSMATPHVAGAIAVLLSATKVKASTKPSERAFVLEDLLVGSVEELGEAGQDHRFGFGRIDVLRAIGFAQERQY